MSSVALLFTNHMSHLACSVGTAAETVEEADPGHCKPPALDDVSGQGSEIQAQMSTCWQ